MSGRNGLIVLVAAVLFLASGCASDLGPVKSGISLAAPDDTSAVRANEMRIAPLDVLDIKVFGTSAFDGSYQVDPEGEIKVPLVGVMTAKGYTVFELAAALEQKLGETYLQNPQVSIRMSQLYGKRLTIDGAIHTPGQLPVRDSMTLLQAIALSGGPTDSANPRRVVIFRTIDGKKQAAAFDLLKIRNGSAPDPEVYGNDTIVVDGSNIANGFASIMRAVPIIGMFTAF